MKTLSIFFLLIFLSTASLIAQTITIRLVLPENYKLNDGAPQNLVISNWDESMGYPSIGFSAMDLENLIKNEKGEYSHNFSAADVIDNSIIMKSSVPLKDDFLITLKIVICDDNNLCLFINHSGKFSLDKLADDIWDMKISLPDS